MKVLVTGVTGFIGRRLRKYLEDKGVAVYGISRSKAEGLENCYQISVVEREKLVDFVKAEGFDAVIHLAALTKRRYGNIPKEEYFKVNVEGTKNVLEAAEQVGARVVFASTSGVYTSAKHPYFESKRAAEKLCEEHGATIARIFNVYGEGKGKDVLEIFILKALSNEPLTVNANQVRDFIYVDDVCQALWLLAEKGEAGAYDVGTGIGTPIEELAKLIIKLTGSSSSIAVNPSPPTVSVADVSKLKELGFEVTVPLEEGVRRVVEYYKEKLSK